jgi:hypothetical protein
MGVSFVIILDIIRNKNNTSDNSQMKQIFTDFFLKIYQSVKSVDCYNMRIKIRKLLPRLLIGLALLALPGR